MTKIIFYILLGMSLRILAEEYVDYAQVERYRECRKEKKEIEVCVDKLLGTEFESLLVWRPRVGLRKMFEGSE